MRVLVTGAGGYVGKAVVARLKDYDVTALTRSVCDLEDKKAVREYFKGKYFHVVIHCAAKIGGRVVEENDNILVANLKMYYNLLENKDHFERFINIGSGAEESRTDTPYGLSKKVIADSVLCYDNFYNLRVWGLFDENEGNTRFIKTCIKTKKVNIHDRRMDYMYMQDFLDIVDHYIFADLTAPKEYNCVYESPVWLGDIAKAVPGCIYTIDSYDEDYVAVDRNSFIIPRYGLWEGIKITYNKIMENAVQNLTIVTGLWNINREGRPFDHYTENFKKFLDIPCRMFVYIQKDYEHLVWENDKRTKENTFVKIYELEDVKSLYAPFWDKTQEIRVNPEWLELAPWLPGSPQASNEWYNPIVQSKMFMMHDVTIWNPFNTKYFLWIDAGLANTVDHSTLIHPEFYNNIVKHIDPFLFLSFKYETVDGTKEIHGLKVENMRALSGEQDRTEWNVCRGGLFGGTKKSLDFAHGTYYGLLSNSLDQGVMGTEESIFCIMSYLRPNYFRRYELPGSMIVDFYQDVIDDGVAKITGDNLYNKEYDGIKERTAVYVLTFNKPKQLEETLTHMERWNPEWLTGRHKYVIDNSVDEGIISEMAAVCSAHGFIHLPQGKNTGIFWGRKKAAEHFDSLEDCDFYVFFEDDMHLNGVDEPIGDYCRNNLPTKIRNLWDKAHGIMVREDLDFLKLTFTEVFLDNNYQVSWYNVSDEKRREYWPKNHKLPVHQFDPDCPRTRYDKIDSFDGLLYAVGQPYYCNWPILMSKRGNKRVFLEQQPERPDERAQMGCVFEQQVSGDIKAAVLLASTITHGRSEHYEQKERREG